MQIRDAVDSGEIPIGLINDYYLYELINSKGADAVRGDSSWHRGIPAA